MVFRGGDVVRTLCIVSKRKTMTIKKEEEIDEASYITCHIESDSVLHETTESVRILFPRHGQLDSTIALELLNRFRQPIF